MDPSLARALTWGLAAYSTYGVALVAMKHGAADILHPGTVLATPESRRRGAIWLLGAAANFTFVVLLSVALKNGHASLIAALNGWSLVVVAGLSRAFLGERLSRADRFGGGAVILGVGLVAGFAGAQGGALRFAALDVALLSLGLVAAAGAAVLVSWRRGWWRGASILGGAAGVLGGLGVILQKIVIEPVLTEGGIDLGALLPSPWFWLYLLASNGAFVVLQFAYPRGRAVEVAPALMAGMLLVPVLGGVLCFGEGLSAPQGIGTALVLVGVLLLTAVEEPAA